MKRSGPRRVLAILGSPHSDGINARMLKVATEKAKSTGCDVEIINLYEKKISYCKGCLLCSKLKHCVIGDDIAELEQKIRDCDILFLACPVYWANVPAAVKNMFDRLRGTAMEDTSTTPRPLLKGRDCFLMTSCRTPMPFAFLFRQSGGALRAMKEFVSYAGIRFRGSTVCSNTSKLEGLPQRKIKEIQRKVGRIVR